MPPSPWSASALSSFSKLAGLKFVASGQNSIVLEVVSTDPQHPFPMRRHALEVCFSMGLPGRTAVGVRYERKCKLLKALIAHLNVNAFYVEVVATGTGR